MAWTSPFETFRWEGDPSKIRSRSRGFSYTRVFELGLEDFLPNDYRINLPGDFQIFKHALYSLNLTINCDLKKTRRNIETSFKINSASSRLHWIKIIEIFTNLLYVDSRTKMGMFNDKRISWDYLIRIGSHATVLLK